MWPLWSRRTERKPWKKRAKPFMRCNCRDCGINNEQMREYDVKQGEIAMEGKMMRKTMEKMREYDIKQWEKMGKEGKMMENDEKNNGKMREYDIKQWEKNGKGGENDEKNNGKNERLWYKTMEKMGKQWKIWVERLENWYAKKNGGKNRERVKWCQVKLRLRCGTIIA